jgi:Putative transposase of IS4/5 family (DUF4096)
MPRLIAGWGSRIGTCFDEVDNFTTDGRRLPVEPFLDLFLSNSYIPHLKTPAILGGMNKEATKKRNRQRTPNNRTTTGFRISDALWAVVHPLLPVFINTHRFGGGRPRVPDRTCADAIFYVLRTGCQWQALDQTELCAIRQRMTAFKPG